MNNLLYRGYNQSGKQIMKKIKFEPTLFLRTQEKTKYKSLYGQNLEPHKLSSMSEAKKFLSTYSEIENLEVFGTTNYIHQYITERFPNDIKFDYDKITIAHIDIEVDSPDGFPTPEEAAHPVVSIALKLSTEDTYVIWGTKKYDPAKNPDKKKIRYIMCKSEEDLLFSFLRYWNRDDRIPDVISGWYIEFFDIPYMVNRITNLMGHEEALRLSPWKIIASRNVNTKFGAKNTAYDLVGIQTLDYQSLFKKHPHKYGPQENYKLDTIANTVLGIRKLSYDEYGSLKTLYRENPQLFYDYNLRDITLIEDIESVMKLLEITISTAYMGGVNFVEALGTTSIWDSIIMRKLMLKNEIVPPNDIKSAEHYPGAYVKEPVPGVYRFPVGVDLDSLYPMTIVQYNISPETFIGKEFSSDPKFYMNLSEPIETKDRCVCANGVTFDNRYPGVIPEIVAEYYANRKEKKREMLKLSKEFEISKDPAIKKKSEILYNEQMTIKILLNSVYGAMGTRYFRYYNVLMAEAITLTGQITNSTAEKSINDTMNKIMKTSNFDYVVAMDTDSCYINLGSFIDKFASKKNLSEKLDFIDTFVESVVLKEVHRCFRTVCTNLNGYKFSMHMSRETISDKGIWTAKKRYILNVLDDENVRYSEPKLKLVGIEAIKSSTPSVVRDKFKELFKLIMEKDTTDVIAFVEDFKKEFYELAAHEIASPRGVNGIKKYLNSDGYYKKEKGLGVPINSRAAILYNYYLKEYDVHGNFDQIYEGDKLRYLYLSLPNPIKENVIGFLDFLPKEFKLDAYIDYKTQFEKTFEVPARPILAALGISLDNNLSFGDLL